MYKFFTDIPALVSLATEKDNVRQTLADYVDDLLSLGVAGLRLDAVKRRSSIRLR